jgi:hypothetical protein
VHLRNTKILREEKIHDRGTFFHFSRRVELSFTSVNPDQTSINEIWNSAREFYERSFSAYANASSRSDIMLDDGISGLLQNWGAGLLSLTFDRHC